MFDYAGWWEIKGSSNMLPVPLKKHPCPPSNLPPPAICFVHTSKALKWQSSLSCTRWRRVCLSVCALGLCLLMYQCGGDNMKYYQLNKRKVSCCPHSHVTQCIHTIEPGSVPVIIYWDSLWAAETWAPLISLSRGNLRFICMTVSVRLLMNNCSPKRYWKYSLII